MLPFKNIFIVLKKVSWCRENLFLVSLFFPIFEYSNQAQFQSQCFQFSFLCCTSIFLSEFLLSITHFCKLLHGLFQGGKETVQLPALLSVHEETDIHIVKLPTDFERKSVIGHWSSCIPIIYIVICRLKT